MIELEELLTSSYKYKDRLNSPDLTDEVKTNGQKLLDKVNPFLNELGINRVDISSGFRPIDINSKIKNAAKSSYHSKGMAIDIVDDDQQNLAKLILTRPDLLKKYELWMEDPNSTKGIHTNWIHLDEASRPDREVRVFIP